MCACMYYTLRVFVFVLDCTCKDLRKYCAQRSRGQMSHCVDRRDRSFGRSVCCGVSLVVALLVWQMVRQLACDVNEAEEAEQRRLEGLSTPCPSRGGATHPSNERCVPVCDELMRSAGGPIRSL